MQSSLQDRPVKKSGWTYAELAVVDGTRRLKPCEVSFNLVRFTEPPHLESSQIEIIVTNGDAGQRTMAIVLPHDSNATLIPIQLIRESLQTF